MDILQNERIQKSSPIVILTIGDDFFEDCILSFRLKAAFCNSRVFFVFLTITQTAAFSLLLRRLNSAFRLVPYGFSRRISR